MMARSRLTMPFVAMIALMALIIGPRSVQSLDMEYCASANTAGTPTNSSIWQSNGLCHDFCVRQSFALAVLQGHYCWCSNYAPAKSSQVDTAECNDPCPGWKYDTCGTSDLFGYIQLDIPPSGTADGSSTSTSSETSTHSSTRTSTTPTPPTPTTSIKTVTAGGTVSLETVTVTPTASAEPDTNTTSHLGTGPIVGIVIGVLGVFAIVAGIAVFICLQHRRRRREEELTSRPHSHLSGSVGVTSTPTTAMASVWDGENSSTGRRNSRLMPHDPRMDPFATNIYSRFENKSRESINTLQDNQDYSRKVLRTTNPDPADD
ncbi:hypothetical protein F5B17DRAFT_405907 [Nemania serpens]|nr:hypothetical protein F5B17DRAFT_405907 [Nemania serpens]